MCQAVVTDAAVWTESHAPSVAKVTLQDLSWRTSETTLISAQLPANSGARLRWSAIVMIIDRSDELATYYNGVLPVYHSPTTKTLLPLLLLSFSACSSAEGGGVNGELQSPTAEAPATTGAESTVVTTPVPVEAPVPVVPAPVPVAAPVPVVAAPTPDTTMIPTTVPMVAEPEVPPAAPALPAVPTDPVVPISFTAGWADGALNNAGIQGAFYPIVDSGGSTVTPSDGFALAEPANAICISGTAAVVVAGDFANIWGAGFGFNFQQDSGNVASPPVAWDATAIQAVGFRANISALPSNGSLRVKYKVVGDPSDYCTVVSVDGDVDILFADTRQSCWEATAATNPTPDPTMLEAIQFQVTTNVDEPVTYDFCLNSLSVLRQL